MCSSREVGYHVKVIFCVRPRCVMSYSFFKDFINLFPNQVFPIFTFFIAGSSFITFLFQVNQLFSLPVHISYWHVRKVFFISVFSPISSRFVSFHRVRSFLIPAVAHLSPNSVLHVIHIVIEITFL